MMRNGQHIVQQPVHPLAYLKLHFVRFDVGTDLSLQVAPSLYTAAQGAPGLSIALTLR